MSTQLLFTIVNFISLPISEAFIPAERNTILLSKAGLEISFSGASDNDYFKSISYEHSDKLVSLVLRDELNTTESSRSSFPNDPIHVLANNKIQISERYFNKGFYKIQFYAETGFVSMYVSVRKI